MDCDVEWLRALVRHVPDFPTSGVMFADITPVLANADALRCAVELLADEFVGRDVDLVAGVEARGFILAAPVACRLGCGFVPIRKAGRLPSPTHDLSYDLEYGSGALEVHRDAASPGQRVVVIDDVLATGGTAAAAVALVEKTGAAVDGLGFLLSIPGLNGLDLLDGYKTVIALGDA
jgi:adenine phosphoribosyltransferase